MLYFERLRAVCSILFVVLFGFNSCSRVDYLRAKSAQDADISSIKNIVLYPLQVGESLSLNKSELEAPNSILLNQLLKTSFNVLEISSSDQLSAVSSSEKINGSLFERALSYSRSFKSDTVLCGVVNKYGSGKTIEERRRVPTAVASFTLWLLDSNTGKVLWNAQYDRRNQALSENVLRLPEMVDEGFSFKSREELIRIGLRDAIKSLDNLHRKNLDKVK